MDQVTLRKVQLTQLEILKEVKRVCEKNGISYWLDCGTFLGAVRHGGFIPWDDDLDIGMLREDYERFLVVCPSELSKTYVMQNWDNTQDFPHAFAKVRKRGTIFKELKAEKLAENGIYIDVFPYDKIPLKNKTEQLKQHYIVDTFKRIVLIKNGYKPWKTEGRPDMRRFFLFLPIRVLALMTSIPRAKRIYMDYQLKFNHLTDNYAYFPSGVLQYGRWVMKKEFLESLEMIKFEDEYFSCPSHADEYLTTGYGDYMTPPPEEKRNIGHSIIEIKF